jgi:hypothetical protein
MKRYVLVLLALMLFAVPLMVEAGDQGWLPPEWTATPPMQPTIDFVHLMQLLRAKGVLSDQEYTQLTQPESSALEQARTRTWDEVYRNPSRRSR